MKYLNANFKGLLRGAVIFMILLASTANLKAQVPDPIYVKGCGLNGGGTYSILGVFIEFKCPYCCQGFCTTGLGGTCHKCNIPISLCGQELVIPGNCPLCIEMAEGISPHTNKPAWKITVLAAGKFWWVSGITEGYSANEEFYVISGTLEGPEEGEILP